MPRSTWLERSSIALGLVLALLGLIALAGWLAGIDSWIQLRPTLPAVSFNSAFCALVFGFVLLGLERGWRRVAWAAVVPTLLAAITLAQYFLQRDFGVDELLVRDHLVVETSSPGRMSAMMAGCVVLGGLVLLARSFVRSGRARLFAEAVSGSVLASIGFSTLLGYASNLPVVVRWGTATATSPIAAAMLVVLGLALLLLAWRENLKIEGGPPSWSPIPAVIAFLTLTIILWIGLRERERLYLATNTQIALESLATATKLELDQQVTAFVGMAQRWGEADDSPVLWETDATLHRTRSPGCVSISWVEPNGRTHWIYPTEGNEASLNLDHTDDPVRADALAEARATGYAVASGSVTLPLLGAKGFVIYSPVKRRGAIVGFIASEHLYRDFFTAINARQKLSANYSTTIAVGGDVVYETSATAPARDRDLLLESVYTIADRRIRFTLTPSPRFLASNRRYLPEVALLAGFGITLLLGLSVHLARTARAGLLAAEQSNKRLLAENEERRRIEARLKVSDERLRLALDSTQIGIFEWNVPAGHVYYSPGLWAMLGYEHGRMPSTVEAWQSLIHPEDLQLFRRRTDSQLNGVTSFIDPEYRVRARSGDWRWVYARSKSVAAAANGTPTRIIGTVQDITARREAEEALRESQAAARKLSLVASRTDNLVMIGSTDGRIEWVNESFTRVMEYTLDEVVGKNPLEFMVGPETNPRTLTRIRASITRGLGVSTDIVNYSKSGRKYHLQLEIQPVRNRAGVLENFIAMLADITARVETENALRRAKAEADAASQAKSQFLASMSHEIRTPMNGVIGMTSLLLETGLTHEQRDFVNTIRTSGEALLTIINDILDFSKIESGKMELEHLPFELSVCLEEALDLFTVQAAAKKLALTYVVEPDVPTWILGDVTRLRQVLVNLVNNAVKFTPSGSISIEVRRTVEPGDAPHRLRLEFAVRDTGIGIPADRVDRLFKAFSQVDSSTTRKYGGTGLGLAICQRLCSLMGGDIRAESANSEGSVFYFTIATEAALVPAEIAPSLPSLLSAGTVLVIEPNRANRQRLKYTFEAWGTTCHGVTDAKEAAELAAALPTPLSLIVVDHSEIERAAPRALLAKLSAPRLLMLPFGQSAPEFPSDGYAYGCVSKPIKTSGLLHAVLTLFNTIAKPAKAARGEDERLLAHEIPLDVLLAEDNPVNQKVALRFLERLGYRADAVGNGIEALTTLESRRYDLVLMDLQMPEMDGLEASRQIRQRLPASRQPKIIALTANALQGDREQCLAVGMDDYITKPVKLHEIEEAIRRQFAPQPKDAGTVV